ncbi:MAG: FxLYD domain-containing protein [Acidobacteria bacterium]|nr:FxLYD domain-containing protein [Acidobacteriota bacterium]MCW5968945.1 FxLYD domain-containing protein [Blastocatellales bacterium]
MPIQEPTQIREARPKGKVILLAALATIVLIAVVTLLFLRESNRPLSVPPEPRLESALRAGDEEFDQNHDRIIVEGLAATQSSRPLGDIVMELTATVKNSTTRTLSGLEMRGAVVDAQGSHVGERTIVVIPVQQQTLEPDQSVSVRVLIEGIKPEADRSGLRMETTALRFN